MSPDGPAVKTAAWLPSRKARADALWLLGAALIALAICAGVMTGILYLERPAPAVQPVQQACITTKAARG